MGLAGFWSSNTPNSPSIVKVLEVACTASVPQVSFHSIVASPTTVPHDEITTSLPAILH
jgi:hypothetical protein